MKKFPRLLSIILTAFLTVGMLIACSDIGKTDDTSAPITFSITDEFVIVQPAHASTGERKATSRLYSALQTAGVKVTAQDDSRGEPAKFEILIGQTSRAESQEVIAELGYGDYRVKVTGDSDKGFKIVLGAMTDDTVAAAVDFFITNYINGENALQMTSDLNYIYNADFPCEKLKIAGNSLADYKIVYAKESATNTNPHIQAPKYKDTAEALAQLIYDASGARLEVIPDTETVSAGTPTILFGKTAKDGDNFAYETAFTSSDAYIGKLTGDGSVVLAGDNACSVYAAGEALVNAMNEAKTELTSFDVNAEKALIKVACIGDSITQGTNSKDETMDNYPVYLQRLLGYDYYVEKYGAPSHSLIESDTQSFLKHAYFEQSVAAKPDVVIVMLGTNDCRTQKWEDSAYKNWRDPQRTENFLASGEKLIAAYREANPDVQIIIATPPTVPQDAWLGTDWTERIEKYGNPLLKQLAKEQDCDLIDIFTYSEEHLEMFHCSDDIPQAERGDGLHPQNETYGILAEGVYSLVKDIIKKPTEG